MLPLAAVNPRLSFNDLNLRRARHQRECEEYEEAVNDGDAVRGFHVGPLVGV